jgi:hypothetical protein
MGVRASHEARDECKTLIPIITLFEALTSLKNHYNVACKTDDRDIV